MMNSNNNNNEQKRMIFKNKIQFKLTRAAMQISERDHPFSGFIAHCQNIFQGFLVFKVFKVFKVRYKP